jgi:hypothetical protein
LNLHQLSPELREIKNKWKAVQRIKYEFLWIHDEDDTRNELPKDAERKFVFDKVSLDAPYELNNRHNLGSDSDNGFVWFSQSIILGFVVVSTGDVMDTMS